MKIYTTLDSSGFPNWYGTDESHGPRRLLVPDPDYVRRQIPDNADLLIDDPNDPAPMIDGGPNPDTKIPVDAVEITNAQYRELLDNQGARRVSVDAGVVAVLPYTPPPPSPEQITAQFTALIQSRLDAFAQTRGYDGILSAATYATSAVAKFASEGRAAVTMRDTTWVTAATILADVQSGARPVPTWAAVEAELPVLEWPA